VVDELDAGEELPRWADSQILQLARLDGRVLQACAAAEPDVLLDERRRREAAAGEVSVIADVAGDRSRILATTAAVPAGSVLALDAGGERVLVVAGTSTDASDAAVQWVESTLLEGGPPAVLLAAVAA
jgi:hypothetical protein